MEFLLIDRDTRLDAFKKELRWNDLYYHLARVVAAHRLQRQHEVGLAGGTWTVMR